MKFAVTVEGLKEIVSGLHSMKGRMAQTLSEGMREAAFLVEAAGKKQITTGSNRAIKTGYLRSSIAVQSIMPLRATVVAAANYGIYVHEGTRFMRARPFLAAGLKDAVPEIERVFGKRVQTLMQFT